MAPYQSQSRKHNAHTCARECMSLRTLFVSAVLFFASILNVYAFTANDSFIVRTFVGSDTTAPSVPTTLVATPITTSQINLSWGSSTDDYELSGYHVWRDDVQVATTTSTSYQDTGLTASTTYSYYVTAFDSFYNFSASSSVATATTLSVPVVIEVEDDSTAGTKMTPFPNQIRSLQIFPQKDSVIIQYETDDFIRSVIKWGKSSSYELGSLVEKAFSTRHETKIIGLTPGTKYMIAIEGENKLNRYGVLHEVSFTTLPPDDIFPPGNVTNVSASVDDKGILLSWDNPSDPDLSKIRVVRSDKFYPSDTVDGWVAYEGLGTSARDILDSDTPSGYQYYTLFSYDALGNISSGAVIRVYFGEREEGEEIDTEPTPQLDPALNPINLSIDDVEFSQEGERMYPVNGTILIDGSKQLSIGIPYDLVPEHLKTILMTIQDSRNHDKTFSFLLRVNNAKTGYVSTIAPLGTSGVFPFHISVFDFTTAQIGYTYGTLTSTISPLHTDDAVSEMSGMIGFMQYLTESYILWFVLLIILLMFIARRLMRTAL